MARSYGIHLSWSNFGIIGRPSSLSVCCESFVAHNRLLLVDWIPSFAFASIGTSKSSRGIRCLMLIGEYRSGWELYSLWKRYYGSLSRIYEPSVILSRPFRRKYTNFSRRGQFLCALLGFIICPWKIEASASRFLGFLNGYTIFLGPISGGMILYKC